MVLLFAAGVLAPLLAPYGADAQSSDSFAGASAQHLLGTDEFGRDVFSRVLFGIRQDVVVAGLAVPVGAVARHRCSGCCAGCTGSSTPWSSGPST